MKYSVETTEKGCVETLEFYDEKLGDMKITAEHERTECGSKLIGTSIERQLVLLGYSDEIIETYLDFNGGCGSLDFLRLHEELC